MPRQRSCKPKQGPQTAVENDSNRTRKASICQEVAHQSMINVRLRLGAATSPCKFKNLYHTASIEPASDSHVLVSGSPIIMHFWELTPVIFAGFRVWGIDPVMNRGGM
eukprot:2794083-Amphidinium_carterae.5